MGFLNVGSWELLVLGVAALMIFGPGKLPEVMGQVGKAVRDFRRMTADLTGEFEKTIAEVDDVKASVRSSVGGVRSQVDSVTSSVKKDLAATGASVNSTAKKATTTKPSTAAARAKTAAKTAASPNTATLVASKADPLADVSALDDSPPVKSNGHAPTAESPSNGEMPGTLTPTPASPPAVTTLPMAAQPSDATSIDRTAALARARQRRAEAAYNRRSHPGGEQANS